MKIMWLSSISETNQWAELSVLRDHKWGFFNAPWLWLRNNEHGGQERDLGSPQAIPWTNTDILSIGPSKTEFCEIWTNWISTQENKHKNYVCDRTDNLFWPAVSQWTLAKRTPLIARFMGPIWGPPGSCRPQMGPLLSGTVNERRLG